MIITGKDIVKDKFFYTQELCLGALDTSLICEKTCVEMRIIMYTYTEEKKFTKEQVQELFLSINWVSGNYPERLYRALMNSSTVLTVWDGERLVGLIRVLDDTAMLAQIHYVIVHPNYQGKGIAGRMIEYIKEKYKNFLYIDCMPAEKKNVAFYEKYGFSVMENGTAMQICNYCNS